VSKTISEIADIAGVSKTTVSLVINGRGEAYRISKKTQRKIRSIVEDNNFVPDQYARGFRLKKTQTIGLVVPDLTNWFFSQISYEIEALARKLDHQLLIACSDDDEDTEFKVIKNLHARRIDGLIIASVMRKDTITKEILNLNIPVVYIDRRIESENVSWVSSDNYQGAYDLINHMCSCGLQKICFLGGLENISTSKNRLRGYRDALDANGLFYDPSMVHQEDYTISSGYKMAERALADQAGKVDGIFTSSLTLLEGTLKYFRDNKKNLNRTPHLIQIGTYDDHPFLDYLSINISSVRQDIGKMAEVAVEMTRDMLDGKEVTKHEVVRPSLIIRP